MNLAPTLSCLRLDFPNITIARENDVNAVTDDTSNINDATFSSPFDIVIIAESLDKNAPQN